MKRWFALMVLSALFCELSLDPNVIGMSHAVSSAVASVGFIESSEVGTVPGVQAEAKFITAPVERGVVEEAVTVTGGLKPVETVEIGSQMAGEVSKLFVDFNDEVHVGQPLAQLDQRTLKAKVDQEQSALNLAKATVDVQLARLLRTQIDFANARASRDILVAKVENAQALATASHDNFLRQKALKATNSTAVSTFEAAQTDLASKVAFLKESSSALDLHGYTVDGAGADVKRLEAEIAQAKAELPLREAALRVAQIELDRSTIRSPIDGVVVGRFINPGQTLAEGLEARAIFTIARDLACMEIHARVDETDIGRLKPGQRASFGVDAYANRRFDAVVRQVRKAAEVNQNVVTYTVVLTTENPQGLLLPGMTAQVRIVTDHVDDALKVPLAALRFDPGTTGKAASSGHQAVWVLDRLGRLKQVAVGTGTSNDDQTVLTSGSVSEADRVVVGQASNTPEHRFLGLRLWF